MSLEGQAKGKTIRGKISELKTLRGYSAYDIAVLNGYSGTQEEWLASLQGPQGIQGIQGKQGEPGKGLPDVTAADNGKVLMVKNGALVLDYPIFARIANVVLLGSGWSGAASPYSQVVTVPGVTARSQVDLTPSVEQLAIFHEKDLAFVAENNGGVVTVYAVGQKPENDYTIQVTITEVSV